MRATLDPEAEKQIRQTIKLGDPWALDELTQKIYGDDSKLRGKFSAIVADEYHRRLSAMPRQEMRELYRRCYKDKTDANKDWLLGEIAENIEAKTN